MDAPQLLLYLATWSLVAVSPGPAVMCAMSQGARHGFRNALLGIAGVQLGHCVFFGCVAGGLAALLSAAGAALAFLRILGAGYLFYLGIRIIASTFRARKQPPASGAPTPARGRLLLQGFVIQVTNPKALLFVSALLPQFLRPDRPLPPQLAMLFTATVAVDALTLSSYAWLASRGGETLRQRGIAAWLERAFGAALILFGVRLLSSRR